MELERDRSSSLKYKLKSRLCFCCFNRHETLEHLSRPRLTRSSSTWLKSTARELPEIKEKCWNLISRIGRYRSQHSADFRYDPLSYALNFDEGHDDDNVDEFPLRNFSARLPASPPTAVAVSREIVACS